MGRINQHEPDNPTRVVRRKLTHVETTKGVSDEDDLSHDAGPVEQRGKFRGDSRARAWCRTHVAVTEPGAVIGADPSPLGSGGLNVAPLERASAEAALQDNSG